jgi:hypothetical protein
VKAIHWGGLPQPHRRAQWRALVAVLVMSQTARADPVTATVPDAPVMVFRPSLAALFPADRAYTQGGPSPQGPVTQHPVVVAPATHPPSWDLDGTYLWLGPIGAASYLGRWDSTFGGEAAIVRVRERAALGLAGVNLGASHWTARGGGRVWIDGLVGTHLLGRMMGASLGPIVEVSDVVHPKLGASIGIWGFIGITPFARVGAVTDLGMFAELGVHIALPVLRR